MIAPLNIKGAITKVRLRQCTSLASSQALAFSQSKQAIEDITIS